MHLPYINIYKGDFLRSNVSGCSIAAQGLWLRLMILMHDSERTGYLCLNGEAMPSRMIAVKCAVTLDEYEPLFAELMSVSAFSTSKEHILFCPEMIAHEQERAKNAERQKRFKENQKSNGKVTVEVTEKKRSGNGVSSLSSSSSNGNGQKPPKTSESQDEYFHRKQSEYPNLDIKKVYANYCKLCTNKGINPKRFVFDKWLENEEEPMTAFLTTVLDISKCPDCNGEGFIYEGRKGARICQHDQLKA